jgi:hypothetical protein
MSFEEKKLRVIKILREPNIRYESTKKSNKKINKGIPEGYRFNHIRRLARVHQVELQRILKNLKADGILKKKRVGMRGKNPIYSFWLDYKDKEFIKEKNIQELKASNLKHEESIKLNNSLIPDYERLKIFIARPETILISVGLIFALLLYASTGLILQVYSGDLPYHIYYSDDYSEIIKGCGELSVGELPRWNDGDRFECIKIYTALDKTEKYTYRELIMIKDSNQCRKLLYSEGELDNFGFEYLGLMTIKEFISNYTNLENTTIITTGHDVIG